MLLIKENNWTVIEEETPAEIDDAWKRRDKKAQATIFRSVEDNQIIHICKCKRNVERAAENP